MQAIQQRSSVSRGVRQVRVQALFKRSAGVAVAEPPAKAGTKSIKRAKKEAPKKESYGNQTFLEALDFSAPRSKKDADLLYQAKYGKQVDEETGKYKMTREQYGALRRKIGGTYKDFMKGYVEEERVEATYYKPTASGGTVPYLGLLVGVVVAMLGTTVFVVSQTQ